MEQSAPGVTATSPAASATSSAHGSTAALHADLLRRSGGGDQSAFAELYDATASRLFGLVLRVVRDHELAREVTQGVYLDVWRQSARFDAERSSASSWLMTTAYRAALDRAGSPARLRVENPGT